ncbi:MAG: YfhO family protein [Muricomes sp.]
MRRLKEEKWQILTLSALCLFFCWLFVSRFGVFGSEVDWVSQHSVFPEYFRRQFYETGQLFPEFALNIGGGQNIYNFAYYGLYSPVVLLSYLLPFVKMETYLMAASAVSLTAAVIIFYLWLREREFEKSISFSVALLFLLAGPMIYHSYNQLMFVSYMPFLCLAFSGVDRFFDCGKTGKYTVSVFLMIMTSFYFSIGGMLALVLYGLHRYYQTGHLRTHFFRDGFQFIMPMAAAVMMSGVLLIPTVRALLEREGQGRAPISWKELFLPKLSLLNFLYSPYGVGLTALLIMVLLVSITYRSLSERILVWGCMIILNVPVFCFLLNGGIYIRGKALIPFLPLLCYLIACYLRKQKNGEISPAVGIVCCVLTVGLVWWGLKEAKNPIYGKLILLDAAVLLFCFLLFWKSRSLSFLIVPSLLFLLFFDGMYNSTYGNIMHQSLYRDVTNSDIDKEADQVLGGEKGFYRMEEKTEKKGETAAALNRIHADRQYISSIYSSAYNETYQKFRSHTFEIEEPYRNLLMQSVSANPVFRKLMGVRYIISEDKIPGYSLCKKGDKENIYENKDVAPMMYATDCLLSEHEYSKLSFPYNQTALMHYAVVDKTETGPAAWEEMLEKETYSTAFQIPEISGISRIQETADSYQIHADKDKTVMIPVKGTDRGILYVQFKLKNEHPKKDVEVWLEGARNKLSSASHIYYNGNQLFTWAVPLEAGQKSVSLTFGKGKYEITGLKAFAGLEPTNDETGLYQSEFKADWSHTKGNHIEGEISLDGSKYVITSIPYDKNFEVTVDGRNVPISKVNTAFLGFYTKGGVHNIKIVYHAPGAMAGKLLSLSGFIVCLILLYRSHSSAMRRYLI